MLGLAVGDAADVDVEHVDLAVDGEVLAVGADQDRGVGGLLALAALGDAAGEQVDAELARPAAGGGRGWGRRAARPRPAAPRRRPAGSTSPAARRARRRRRRRRAPGARPRRGCAPCRSVELSCTAAARNASSGFGRCWLIDQSIGPPSIGGAGRVSGQAGARSRSCRATIRSKTRVGISSFGPRLDLGVEADQVAGARAARRSSACSIASATFSGGIPRSREVLDDLADSWRSPCRRGPPGRGARALDLVDRRARRAPRSGCRSSPARRSRPRFPRAAAPGGRRPRPPRSRTWRRGRRRSAGRRCGRRSS